MNMSVFELNDARWQSVLDNLKMLDQPWCLTKGGFARCVPQQTS